MVVSVVIILFSWRTISRNVEGGDPIQFYENELLYTTHSPRLYNQTGRAFLQADRFQRALCYFRLGVEIDVTQSFPNLWYNMGTTYLELKRYDESVLALLEALKIQPDMLRAHELAYKIFLQAGQDERAEVFQGFISRLENGEAVTREEIESFQ